MRGFIFHFPWQMIAVCLVTLISISCATAPAPEPQVPKPLDVSTFIELDWQAPEVCPTHEQILRTISKMIDTSGDLVYEVMLARVVIQKRGTRYRLQLRTEHKGEKGRRSMRDSSCQSVANAAAFIVALALDPDAQMVAVVEEPEPPPEPEPEPEPTGKTWEQRHWYVGLGGVVQLGVVPKFSGGASVVLGRRWKIWHLQLSGLAIVPRVNKPIPTDDATTKFSNWNVGLESAALFPFGRWRLGPLLGTKVGMIKGIVRSVDAPANERQPWWEIDAGARAVFHLRKGWALAAQGELGIALTRPRFIIRSVGEAHQPNLLLGRFHLLAELHF